MLKTLEISNFALINSIEIEFDNGFSVMTGETGSGKSIILGALSLILGKRADFNVIKDKDKKCVVEAIFDVSNYQLNDFFLSHDLDYSDSTIIRREIHNNGKSRAFINDSPVTLEVLQKLSDSLIDIHSQHQTLGLIDKDSQFDFIDNYVGNQNNIKSYRVLWKDYNERSKQLEQLQQQLASEMSQQDYQNFVLNELVEANLDNVDFIALENELMGLENAEFILKQLGQSNQMIEHDDIGVLSQLKQIENQISKIAHLSPKYQLIKERLSSVVIELKDINNEMFQLQDDINTDDSQLNLLQDSINAINKLFQKHQVNTISELIEIRTQLEQKSQSFESLETKISELKNVLETLYNQLIELAENIHSNRVSKTSDLSHHLQSILSDLGMKQTQFNIEITKQETLTQNGIDDLSFLVSTNQGMPFLELKKVASGGELSRIMLAIKSILSKNSKLPTIIFDEIDTGVSGDIAQKMSQMMLQMSQTMQVISITHLPQIAALGQTHYKVYKYEERNGTQTSIKKLDNNDRLLEIAQMISGNQVTETALSHAQSLLNIN